MQFENNDTGATAAPSNDERRLRGWVGILPNEPGFVVYDWSENYDSGYCAGCFSTRQEAEVFALNWAREHNRKMESAVVIPFAQHSSGVTA
jgi:hypothetical protein